MLVGLLFSQTIAGLRWNDIVISLVASGRHGCTFHVTQQHCNNSLAVAGEGAEVHVARYIEINSRCVAHHRVPTKKSHFILDPSLLWG